MAGRIYVAVDLETTGLDPARDAILEVALVRFQDDRILDRFSSLINPRRPIPLRIQQITGITDRDVAGAPSWDAIVPEVLNFVDARVEAVVAHSAGFDLGFLQAAGVRFHRPALDTFDLAAMLLPGMTSYSLGSLCASLDVPLDEAHRALADATATARLLMVLKRRADQLPLPILLQIVHSAGESAWPPLALFADAYFDRLATGGEGEPTPPAPLSPRQSAPTHPVTAAPGPAPRTIDLQQIESLFDAQGPLAQEIGPGYEVRLGQIDMACQVTAALNQGDHILVEAGTGTGKSLAYLLPAALWGMANHSRVVIATNTLALQDQLLDKDIPQTRQALTHLGHPSDDLGATLLKGRQNYLCTRRLHSWQAGGQLNGAELQVLAKVLIWSYQTQTGDVAELFLPTTQEQAIWRHLCCEAATCTRERCVSGPDGYRGYFWQARQRADQAHLVVVNHALLMADLTTGGRVLPAYDHLIVDEAHRLEEAATEQLTVRFTDAGLRGMLRQFIPGSGFFTLAADNEPFLRDAERLANQVRRTETSVQEVMQRLQRFAQGQSALRADAKYAQRLTLDGRVRTQPRWSQLEVEWDEVSGQLRRVHERGAQLVQRMQGARWWSQEPYATQQAHLEGLCGQLQEMIEQLDQIIFQPHVHFQRDGAVESVSWLEYDAQKSEVALCLAPIYVDGLVERDLLHAKRSVIFTGATLRTDEGFGFIRERLGLADVEFSTVPSPFDYQQNTLLCLPGDMPLPDSPGYQAAVESAIVQAAQAAQGRTLVLFTSYSHLRTTANGIRGILDQMGVVVLEQGASSRRRLLREYRQSQRAVLLGARTFWEGVDLPGDELTCLLIARLPFAVPTDPLVAARSRDLEDAFGEYTLPDAVLRFRQGFGRLIRRASDRGAVVVLDSRMWRKSYGSSFLDSLPVCTVSRAPLPNLRNEIRTWLTQGIK